MSKKQKSKKEKKATSDKQLSEKDLERASGGHTGTIPTQLGSVRDMEPKTRHD